MESFLAVPHHGSVPERPASPHLDARLSWIVFHLRRLWHQSMLGKSVMPAGRVSRAQTDHSGPEKRHARHCGAWLVQVPEHFRGGSCRGYSRSLHFYADAFHTQIRAWSPHNSGHRALPSVPHPTHGAHQDWWVSRSHASQECNISQDMLSGATVANRLHQVPYHMLRRR